MTVAASITTHSDFAFRCRYNVDELRREKCCENISSSSSTTTTTTTTTMGKEDWPECTSSQELYEKYCQPKQGASDFEKQEREFEVFYKPYSSKIKQRLWLITIEGIAGGKGREQFHKIAGATIVRWAVGQVEEGPNGYPPVLRFAIMTEKQYTQRRIETLLRAMNDCGGFMRIRPGATIKGSIVLVIDIARRLPDTEIFEYGKYPRLSPTDDDSADDEYSEDEYEEALGGRDAILEEALKFDNSLEAMNYIKQKDRLWYISSQKQIRQFIDGEIIDRSNRGTYDAGQFNTPLLDLQSTDHKHKAVVLIGPTGMGKTQWALAHFKNPVHIRDKNDYARITDVTDGLVLDDLDQMHWHPLSLLKLVECETNVTMNVKYGAKIIRAGMPRFIIANSWELFWPQNFRTESIDAVERRVVSYVVKAKLYGATTSQPTMNRMPRCNFLFVANNIARYIEVGKNKRAASLRELEVACNREKYKHCRLPLNTGAGTGTTAGRDSRGAAPGSVQAAHADDGAQPSEAVPPAGLEDRVARLADD